MNHLPPNEQVLFESPGGGLVLTTHRVRHEVQGGGSGTLTSIMLEEVASCSTARVQHAVLLVIAAISLILGGTISSTSGGSGDAFELGFIIALVLVGLYFASRQHILSLASAGATIRVNVVSMKAEQVTDFINQLEFAKNARYFARQGGANS